MRAKIVCAGSALFALCAFCGVLLSIEHGRTITHTFIGVIVCCVVCGICALIAFAAADEIR